MIKDPKEEKEFIDYLKNVRKMTLMYNEVMNAVFDNNIPLTQKLLRAITGDRELEVISVTSQRRLNTLFDSRTPVLDILARDKSGKYYDIEIQRGREEDIIPPVPSTTSVP